MQNYELERKQILDTAEKVDAFHKLSLSKLKLLTDDELDIYFARTAELDIAAWLIRAEILQIKLDRNKAAGSPKSKTQIATELAGLIEEHVSTLLIDVRVAALFNKYKFDLKKNVYRMVLSLNARHQDEALKLADFYQRNGNFTVKEFKKKVEGMKIAEKKMISRQAKNTESRSRLLIEN